MQTNNQKRRVCIVIFGEVEVLDFCGPFEVFSVTGGRQGRDRRQAVRLRSTVAQRGFSTLMVDHHEFERSAVFSGLDDRKLLDRG